MNINMAFLKYDSDTNGDQIPLKTGRHRKARRVGQ